MMWRKEDIGFQNYKDRAIYGNMFQFVSKLRVENCFFGDAFFPIHNDLLAYLINVMNIQIH